METARLLLNRSVIVRLLGVGALLLVLAGIGVQLSRYLLGRDHLLGLLSLDSEANIPTFFSALLLTIAALLLAVIAALAAQMKKPDRSKWAILSVGFLIMAVDETASIHERFIHPIRELLGNESLGVFYYAWIIPGILLVLALGLFFLGFVWRLPATTRSTIILAATLYLAGAIGIEMIGGVYDETYGDANLTYAMIAAVEEGLEMAGLIVFLYALLGYMADTYDEVALRFVRKDARGESRTGSP